MTEAFLQSFETVIGHEGGFTDDPKDVGNWTGGRRGSGINKGTKYGISAKAFPHLDIVNLTLEDAKRIYWEKYWLACACDLLPVPLAHSVFDTAVNQGVGRSKRFLQHAAGTYVDGKIGPATRRAINRAALDPTRFLVDFTAERLFHYMTLDELDDRFGRGWARRSLEVLLDGLKKAGSV